MQGQSELSTESEAQGKQNTQSKDTYLLTETTSVRASPQQGLSARLEDPRVTPQLGQVP